VVGNLLFRKETLEIRLNLASLDGSFIRVVGAVQAEGGTSDGMVGIVRGDIVGWSNLIGTNNVGVGFGDVHRVTERLANHTIDVRTVGETASKSIERTVFLNQDNDVLDVVLPGVSLMSMTRLLATMASMLLRESRCGQREEGYRCSLNHNHI
jgi:hypothetical protein